MKSKKMLIVEDGVAERRLLKTVPEEISLSSRIDVVSSGREAVDYLNQCVAAGDAGENTIPGMILIDLTMPGMDGFELMGEIVKRFSFQHCWVLAFSSNHTEAAVRAAYDLGAHAYLVKPPDYEGLLFVIQVLDRILAKNRWDLRLLNVLPFLRLRHPAGRRSSARRIRGSGGGDDETLTVNGQPPARFRSRSC